MSDQQYTDERLETGDELPMERSDETETPSTFVNAVEFVDNAIDEAEDINEISVEALVVLNVLRIVKKPTEVRVNVIRSQRLTIIELDVHSSDLGPLIGRGGHTIDAVRDVAIAAAGGSEIKYVIYPLEEGRPPRISVYRSYNGQQGRRSYRRGSNG